MSDSPHVIDVDEAGFQQQVLERSRSVPVLVDFWAGWCQPCRVLGPILERVVDELDGAVVLAKVDSDANPQLAAEFGVRGIPHVSLVRDGEVVDRFVGVRREAEVLEFLRRHLPSPADEVVAEAGRLLAGGELEAAEEAYERALTLDDACHAARVGRARVALAVGDAEVAADVASAVPASVPEGEAALRLAELAALSRELAGAVDADDEAARRDAFRRAVAAIAGGREEQGLEALLGLAEADRAWHQEAARRAMVATFHLVGARSPLSEAMRERLRRVYY
ncbi:MAG: tetratricopeptide repeat protein [Acidobacteriota bacterium]